jgi:hypothetical protein
MADLAAPNKAIQVVALQRGVTTSLHMHHIQSIMFLLNVMLSGHRVPV